MAHQMFIAAAETLAGEALEEYSPTDEEKVQAKKKVYDRAIRSKYKLIFRWRAKRRGDGTRRGIVLHQFGPLIGEWRISSRLENCAARAVNGRQKRR